MNGQDTQESPHEKRGNKNAGNEFANQQCKSKHKIKTALTMRVSFIRSGKCSAFTHARLTMGFDGDFGEMCWLP